MTLHRLQPTPSPRLLSLVEQRRWIELAATIDAGVSPCVPASGRLCLFDWFLSRVGLLPSDEGECIDQRRVMEAFIRAWPGPDTETLPPVIMATLAGRPDFVSMLISAGHDANARDSDGHNAASAVAMVHMRAPISIARQRTAPEVSYTDPLIAARLSALGMLASSGLDLDGPTWNGAPPLLLAVLAKNSATAHFLLSCGASHTPSRDVMAHGASDMYRLSPLEAAIVTCNENIVAALIQHGADPLQPSSLSPRTASTLVELVGGLGLSGMLAAIRTKLPAGHPGFTRAFSYALEMGNDDVVQWCLLHGYPMDMEFEDGNRPAHLVARNGRETALMHLLALGADMKAANANGHSAWDVLERHHPLIASRLRPTHDRGTVLPFRSRPG